jgi:hypothetical protein
VSIRRLFWLGAAVLFSVAAIIAIGAVLTGSLGQTDWKILATCGIVFVTGSTALAGFACIDRGIARPVGYAAVTLGIATFALWTAGVWSGTSSDPLEKLAGALGAWTLAALVAATVVLLASARPIPGALGLGTIAAACLAAVVGTEMIAAEDGGPWKLLVVLVILTLLGYVLIPVGQRLAAGRTNAGPSERLLGTIGSVDVVAVRGDGRTLRIGDEAVRLGAGEAVVLRARR